MNPINIPPTQKRGGLGSLLGKVFGGAAGAVAGTFAGNPIGGATLGYNVGGTLGGLADKSKNEAGAGGVGTMDRYLKNDLHAQDAALAMGQKDVMGSGKYGADEAQRIYDYLEEARTRLRPRLEKA